MELQRLAAMRVMAANLRAEGQQSRADNVEELIGSLQSMIAAAPAVVQAEVSEAVQRVMAFLSRRAEMRGLDQEHITGLDGDKFALTQSDLLALCAARGAK